MNEHYSYDELYGTLVYQNEADDIRKYFVIECQYYKFYRWMFQHGWNLHSKKSSYRNGLKGYEVTLRTNRYGV